MIALVAVALFAQTTISIGVGNRKKTDSARAARTDSIQMARETRRDSLLARRIAHDSIDHARRLARRVPLTPALLANAFRDERARTLLNAARAARLEQVTRLRRYDATSY